MPTIPSTDDAESGRTVLGTATVVHGGSMHGMVCDGAVEGVAEAVNGSQVGSCGSVLFRQIQNSGGNAKFEIQVANSSEPINTIAMTLTLSSVPTADPIVPGGTVLATDSLTSFIVILPTVLAPQGGPPQTRELFVEYDPYYGTACVVDSKCEYCRFSAECANFDYATPALQDTFFEPDFTDYFHESTVVYTCGTALGFDMGGGVVNETYELACGWDGEWSRPPVLPNCTWTHCLQPPEPDNIELLEEWNGDPVEFNYTIPYKCERGQRFLSDITIPSADAVCREGNVWEKPDWGVCVESEENEGFFLDIWELSKQFVVCFSQDVLLPSRPSPGRARPGPASAHAQGPRHPAQLRTHVRVRLRPRGKLHPAGGAERPGGDGRQL